MEDERAVMKALIISLQGLICSFQDQIEIMSYEKEICVDKQDWENAALFRDAADIIKKEKTAAVRTLRELEPDLYG